VHCCKELDVNLNVNLIEYRKMEPSTEARGTNDVALYIVPSSLWHTLSVIIFKAPAVIALLLAKGTMIKVLLVYHSYSLQQILVVYFLKHPATRGLRPHVAIWR
jgi:hypothetical protein